MNKKGLAPILIVLLVAILGIGGYFVYTKNKEKSVSPTSFIFTLEECIKAPGSKVTDSYPKRCESSEGRTYIEQVTEPVNTEGWNRYNTGLGFSFKCPPGWKCLTSDDKSSAIVQADLYLNLSFGFYLITMENFQQSAIRHPSYKNPVNWLNDLRTKKPISIKVLPQSIKYPEGTDAIDYPIYHNFQLDKVSEIDAENSKIVVVPIEVHEERAVRGDEHHLFIPLNNQSLAYLYLEHSYYNDPVAKAIIKSIKVE